MDQKFYDMVEANPVIAAIKDTDGLEKCCRLEEIKVIFILYGDICSIAEIVGQVRQAGDCACGFNYRSWREGDCRGFYQTADRG